MSMKDATLDIAKARSAAVSRPYNRIPFGLGKGPFAILFVIVGLVVVCSGAAAKAVAGATSQPASQQVIDQWQWRPIWARQAGAATTAADEDVRHADHASIRVEHTGTGDWSLQPQSSGTNQPGKFPVKEGDLLEVSAFVKVQGQGDAAVSVVTFDKQDKTVEWMYGVRSTRETKDWVLLRARVVIPAGVATIVPRLTGNGPATVWMEGFALVRKGNVADLGGNLPGTLSLENKDLSVAIDTRTAALSVQDRRTGQTWSQTPVGHDLVVIDAKVSGKLTAKLTLLHVPLDMKIKVSLELDKSAPELGVSVSADDALPESLLFPHPFAGLKGSHLIVPLNEGIDYPADDESIKPMHLVAYGGHGICMSFWGITDPSGKQGQMAILETPDDAAIRIERQKSGPLYIAPVWEGQKGRFGYARKLRYVFIDKGGHVAMCKRYREHAQKTGLLKTLADKRKANPNVDLLVGAVNVWCREKDALGIVKQLQAAGIDRILWSNAASPETIKAMNTLGVLTSRYDIFQDVMDPAKFPLLQWKHGDWPTEAWPKDIIVNARGDWIKGWEVEAKDGSMVPCGVVCDKQAIAYADKRIPEELKSKPYRCRFIDTTTASPWRECYSPDHPMTRTDSRKYKMDLLDLVSSKYKLVCGSETGHDAAVPFVHYFEGMMSLGPYRSPDSGRHMQKILDEVPDRVAKFQVGWQYRLPLWELVYHDCVVAQWYWGDYNNKLPAIWDKRDLFNALYGTPPMFMFDKAYWEKNKNRFVQSYKATCPIARATGYSEMTDHKFLTADRSVQQTTFSNGLTVTVNFGEKAFKMPEGGELAPGAMKSTGVPAATTAASSQSSVGTPSSTPVGANR